MAQDQPAGDAGTASRADDAARLARSEERLRLVQRAGGVGALEWDLVTNRVWRSEDYCRIHGLDPTMAGEGVHDPGWFRRIHDDEREALMAWHRGVVSTIGPFAREYRIVWPDGQVRWVSNRGEVEPGSNGAPARLLSVQMDVTERREQAERLAAQAEELAAIYAAAPIGLCVLDGDLRYLRINDRLAEINGAPAAAHIGRRVSEMVPDLTEQATAALRRVLAGEALYGIEISGRTPARPDQVRTWRENWVPLRDAGGTICGIIISAEDVTAERQMTAALAEREALLAAVGASSPDPVYAKDREGRMLYANPATLAALGLDAEAVIGRSSPEFAPEPQQGRTHLANDLAVVASGRTAVVDEVVTAADGRTRIYQSTKSPLRDATGAVIGVVGLSVDVTDRRRSEAQQAFLLDLSDRLRQDGDAAAAATAALGPMLGAARVGYVTTDADRRLRLMQHWAAPGIVAPGGRFALADFGAAALAVLLAGQTLVITDATADARIPVADAFVAASARSAIAVPLQRDGRLAAALFVADRQARRWRADEVRLVEEVATRCWAEVQRREAESALKQLNADLEARVVQATAERNRLWALTDDLIVTGDFAGRTLALSDSWRRLLGHGPDWLMNTHFADVVHPDDLPMIADQLARLQRAGGSVRYENRVRDSAGGWHIVAWTLSADPDGRRFHGVGRDVTAERAQAAALAATQAQLGEMQKLETIGQLTGGVAHDFNNLLTPIIGGLALAERRLDDPRSQRVLAAAQAAAERARLLIERLLAFARRQMLLPQPVDVAVLLVELRAMVLPLLGGGVRIAIDTTPGLPPVLADPTQLELAILNLAINARDAMPDGGVLTIGAAPALLPADGAPAGLHGDFVRLSVVDTGCGMDADTLARAVEPFFTTKPGGQGTGLGLSMVHGLAAQSGGAFRLDSAPGKGTTATLWLPVAVPADT